MSVYAAYHDEELTTLLQNGDEYAFREIYARYWKPLYYSALNILNNKESCQDIIQELFIDIWQRRNSLQVQTSLKGYLFTAVRYKVFKEVRKSADESLFTDLDNRLSSFTGDSHLLFAEIQRLVKQAVDQLPDACRQVYILSREEDLSHAEIAQKLNISTKTVANQLTKALKHIRTSLGLSLFSILFF